MEAEQNKQGAFYIVSAEQLEDLASRAADKVAAMYEAKQTDRLITATAAAKYLNVDKSTLWRWGKMGILHPQRIGGKVLYSENEIKGRAEA